MKLLFACTLCVAVFGCQLNEPLTVAPQTPDSPSGFPLVKEEATNGSIGTFTYNAKGQLVEGLWDNGYRGVYTYSPTRLDVDWYNESGTLTEHITMSLNEKGLRTDYVETGNARRYAFAYDSLNRLTKETAWDEDDALFYEWYYFYNADGNLEKDSVYRHESGIWRVYRHEYYTDIINTLSNKNFGNTYLGESSKNYRKRSVYSSSVGELTVRDYLPPVLDEKNRIIEFTLMYTQNNGSSGSYTYAYKYY